MEWRNRFIPRFRCYDYSIQKWFKFYLFDDSAMISWQLYDDNAFFQLSYRPPFQEETEPNEHILKPLFIF